MSKLLLFLFAADFNKILRQFFALIFFLWKRYKYLWKSQLEKCDIILEYFNCR